MADKDHLIITAVGPDQIGLVEKISEFIARHGCNIEDSKMAVFCGEFALILLISGDGGNLFKIANHYRELEIDTGLAIAIKTPSSRKPPESFLPYALTVSCMDHPGIVYQISGYFERPRDQHRSHGNHNLRSSGERHTDFPARSQYCGSHKDQYQCFAGALRRYPKGRKRRRRTLIDGFAIIARLKDSRDLL